MKTILLLILLFISNLSAQQYYYTFTELKGIEDNSGDTHLFYRKGDDYFKYVSVYHLDLTTLKDTMIIEAYRNFFPGGELSKSVTDYEFFNNDPLKFIYTGAYADTDPTGYIARYDSEAVYSSFNNPIESIEVSNQNNNNVYASKYNLLKSFDEGFNWIEEEANVELIKIAPFNDQILFCLDDNARLSKSTDGGNNFFIADTITSYLSENSIHFDKDTIPIYRVFESRGNKLLSVSNDQGKPFTWSIKYSSPQQLYLSVDYSQSGHIYLSDGRFIYHSTNYGETFNLFKELDRRIVGIYKKPNSDILYAATKYDLYEITPDTIISLKHLIPDPDIFKWYPLEIGNKWIYEKTIEIYKSRFSIEVIGDTVISGKYYFKLRNVTNENLPVYYFERIDSSEGKIYQYINETHFPIYDFTAEEIGDTVIFYSEDGNEYGWVLQYEEQFNQWGLNSTARYFNAVMNFSGYFIYTFVKNLGLFRDEGGEVLYTQTTLQGFIKDGVVYGDTTLVGINDPEKNLPNDFALFQNYPNPFNPITKIKYTIPSSLPLLTKERAGVRSVTLKIYDILGNEITTLVNEEQAVGEYEVEFDTAKYNLSSGIYFYQLKMGTYSEVKKMTILK